jgi:hypothetical protein
MRTLSELGEAIPPKLAEKPHPVCTTLNIFKNISVLVPSRAPTNLRVVNRTSSTSLQLSWDPVSQDYIHGILTGYTVRYQAIEEGAGVRITESRFSTLNVPAHVNSVEIRNLASYTRYKLTMFAKTKVGNGVFSKAVVGGMLKLVNTCNFCCDCRCDFLLLMYVNEWMSWACLDEGTCTPSIHNLLTCMQTCNNLCVFTCVTSWW